MAWAGSGASEVPVCRLRSGLNEHSWRVPQFARIFWKLVTHLKLNYLFIAKIAFSSLHGLFAYSITAGFQLVRGHTVVAGITPCAQFASAVFSSG